MKCTYLDGEPVEGDYVQTPQKFRGTQLYSIDDRTTCTCVEKEPVEKRNVRAVNQDDENW